MYPILYETFTLGTVPQDNGLGVLSDCISCEVEEARNGIYELVMEYPLFGIHAQEFASMRVIKAKPNHTDNLQLFFIDRIGATLNGKFTVYGKHISYLASNFPILSGEANNVVSACAMLSDATCLDPTNHPNEKYTIQTTKDVTATFKITEPSSVRSWFCGKKGSLLDVYGTGEWQYDNFTCTLKLHRGVTTPRVTIRYGKNLLELSQELDCSNLYTHVICYWKGEDGEVVSSDQQATGLTLNLPKVLVVDVSEEYEEKPEKATLNTRAQQYIASNNLTVPTNNIKLGYEQSDELSNRVDLCDMVTVYYEALGISGTLKCIRTKWDVIKERYIETEFGDVRLDLADAMVEGQAELNKAQKNINQVYKEAKDYTDAVKQTLDGDIENLQSQIDGNITTWYYNYAPTTSNLPASEWTTETEKEKHAGDLFFDNTTQFCYRWTYSSGAWTWVLIQDTGIAQALAAAQAAQDTADHKRRVFLTTPVPPYDIGDLWIFEEKILFCNTAKAAGTIYSEDDWLSVDTVDSTAMEDAIKNATDIITGTTGGYVILHCTNPDPANQYNPPNELLIVNNPDVNNATEVWRWNLGGLGFATSYASSNYAIALTHDGRINASMITVGELDAQLAKIKNLAATMFSGATIELGGYENQDGRLVLKNAQSVTIGVLDTNGMEFFGEAVGGVTPSVVFDKNGVTGYSDKDNKATSKIFWTNKDEFHMKNGVVENEASFGGEIRFVPIDNGTNKGIAIVKVV